MGRLSHHIGIAAFCTALVLSAAVRLHAEELQVVKSGKYYGAVDAYRAGDTLYLEAKSAAKIFGAQVYWHAVQGVVQLSFRGRQVAFKENSTRASIDGKGVEMSVPMIVRVSHAFIPAEFFARKEFSDLAGVDIKLDPKTRLLLVDQRSTVGPLRWFTYPDHTRVVVELREGLRYQTQERGVAGMDISMPNGTIDWSEKIDVQDGVVETIHLYQDKEEAHLALRLQDGADGWRLREFPSPRRLVVDVKRRSGAKPPPPAPVEITKAAEPPPAALDVAQPEAEPRKEEPKKEEVAAQPVAAPAARKRYRIAIDAGHGGKDGGAVGRRGTLEKDINLNVADELESLLKQEGIFEVLRMRKEDVFVPLGDRSHAANTFKADLFVSLHCNASTSRAQSGFEIYFLSERASDPDAERLAEFENSVLALEGKDAAEEDAAASLLYALAKTEFINDASEMAGLMARSLAGRVDMPNRGVRQAAFYVLRGVHAPAVLVEMGYLSNSQDEAKLQSKKYRGKIVEGLYAGILEYARRKGWRTEGE
ncbi:MAG: N-acetylmuramoyl-L-alanine amidase [Elusimicrobiota bacterium]